MLKSLRRESTDTAAFRIIICTFSLKFVTLCCRHYAKVLTHADASCSDLGEKSSGPHQRHIKFPGSMFGKQNRAFVGDWFTKFPWIEYSSQLDASFCFACRHFCPRHHYAEKL